MLARLKTFYASLSPWAQDTIERAAATAAQTFVASVPVSSALAAATEKDFSALYAIGVSAGSAAIAAGLAVLKARIAKRVGFSDSASLDPRI